VGARPLVQLSEGLVGPAVRANIAAYAGSYLALREYMDMTGGPIPVPAESVVRFFADDAERLELVAQLVRLNHYTGKPEVLARLEGEYRSRLKPVARAGFDAALHSPDQPHVFLSKQPLLAALRYLLITEPSAAPANSRESMLTAVLLTHAMASTLESNREAGEQLGEIPADILLEVVRTALIGHSVDIYATLDRTIRLWRDYGSRITRSKLDQTPLELLAEATQLDIFEILAFAWALLARRISGLGLDDPIFDRHDLGVGSDPSKVKRFLDLTSDTWDRLRARLEGADRRFGFLAFEATPILSTEPGLLVIDEDYLWQKVTSGLFWIVHDYLKFTKAPGTDLNLRWNETFGEMVELYVEDALREMSPQVLGGAAGETFYTEEDFQRAYGETKRCDVAVYFGSALLLVEVIGGRMAVPTRIDGDPHQFAKDTDRLVIDKCRQLNEACEAVRLDEQRLTGFPSTPGIRFVPVVVVGGGYPVNPLTRRYIGNQLRQEGLFANMSVERLCILDLEDVDMLEGLCEGGRTPLELLAGWQASDMADLPLKSYVIQHVGGWGVSSRPSRMRDGVEQTFRQIVEVLDLPPDLSSPSG
jgi:hypothetical protein